MKSAVRLPRIALQWSMYSEFFVSFFLIINYSSKIILLVSRESTRGTGRGSKSYDRNYHREKCLQLWMAPNCSNNDIHSINLASTKHSGDLNKATLPVMYMFINREPGIWQPMHSWLRHLHGSQKIGSKGVNTVWYMETFC